MIKTPIQIQIDRLVDGELGEDERRDLLLRLESDPEGWRRCALAFLEAQEFGHSARAWIREHAAAVVPTTTPIISQARGRRPLRLALAASLLALAFLSGLAAGRRPGDRSEVVANEPVPEAVVQAPTVEPEPVSAAISDYDRAIWERSGYQVEPARKLISVKVDDGRPVTMPVAGVSVRYVGRPTS